MEYYQCIEQNITREIHILVLGNFKTTFIAAEKQFDYNNFINQVHLISILINCSRVHKIKSINPNTSSHKRDELNFTFSNPSTSKRDRKRFEIKLHQYQSHPENLEGEGGGRKETKTRGSDIKSGEYNNFNNIIIKVIRIRHKPVKKGMTVKQVGKTKQTRGIFWR